MRRKGELSAARIDRGWPNQVVLPARLCERGGYNEIHEFCRDLTLCSRGHALIATTNGFTSIVSKSQRTPKNSWRDLAARSSILWSAAAAPTGRSGKKDSACRPARSHKGATPASFPCRETPGPIAPRPSHGHSPAGYPRCLPPHLIISAKPIFLKRFYPKMLGSGYLLMVAAPALQTTSSCEPVAPEQPIAPMSLPSSISGIPPREATMSSRVAM
jgi:hypothetical protein